MKPTTSHVIIYSHGFGVRKENRGLFTAIAKTLPNAHHVMFDYDPFHKESGTLTVKPLDAQMRKLRKVLNETRAEYPGATIDIVCHSQGCVVAAMLKPRYIRKIIMLAPPDDVSIDTVAINLGKRAEAPIDVTVRTRLTGSNGSTTVIHPEYWQSLVGIKPVKLYNLLARVTTLRIMNAKDDEVLGKVRLGGLDPRVSMVSLGGGHSFDDDDSRTRLLHILQKELTLS